MRSIEQNIHDQERALSVVRSQKEDALEKTNKLREELELAVSELQEVEATLAAVKKREEQLNYQLDTVNQDIEWCQVDIKDKQNWITAKSQEKEEVTVAIAQMETELESQKDKLSNSQEHLEMFSKDLDSWLEEIKRIDDEITTGESRSAQLQQEIQALVARIDSLKQKKESFKAVMTDFAQEKQGIAQRIQGARTNMSAMEQEIDEIKQEVHDQQMKEQELTFEEKSLKDRLHQAYKINIDEVPQEPLGQTEAQAPQTEEIPLSGEALIQEIERLRKRCDAFGNVNLVAIEEYEELKKRFEFLTRQQSDLFGGQIAIDGNDHQDQPFHAPDVHGYFYESGRGVPDPFQDAFRRRRGGVDPLGPGKRFGIRH